MTTPCNRRLLKDLEKIHKIFNKNPSEGIRAGPSGGQLHIWNALMFGPDDTDWQSGTFFLRLEFTQEYPKKAPHIQFLSPMYHPNIYKNGTICLDILQNNWSPLYDVAAVLLSIRSLLCDPNCSSPANPDAAALFTNDYEEYRRRVLKCVESSWVTDVCTSPVYDAKAARLARQLDN